MEKKGELKWNFHLWSFSFCILLKVPLIETDYSFTPVFTITIYFNVSNKK